ncbi:MAG: hypothetical protein FWG64_12655 [Firmicutes bacterium]|nr:hypothetical protein [Bacillota bacterium]
MFGYEYSLEEEMVGREIVAREEEATEFALSLIEFGIELNTIAKAAKRPLQWVENLISQNRSD